LRAGRDRLAPKEPVMSKMSIRILAMAGILALALPAAAASRGGGGGGGHSGGGGGGGGHGGGGGGGGGFRGGGGGGGAHFSAPSFSRGAPAMGGGVRSFGGPAFRGGIPRSFSGQTFRGRSFGGLRVGPRGIGVSRLHANRFGVNRLSVNRLGANRLGGARGNLAARPLVNGARAARLAAPAAVVGGAAFAAHGARWQQRGDWRQRRGFFGWAGPLFWPYAYDDLYDDVLWGYGPYYDDPFWAYGYGDIYGALFSPFGYDDLAGWAPLRMARGGGGVVRRGASAQPGPAAQPSQWSAMCGDDAREVVNLPIDRIDAAVAPNDQQRAALDALANASVQAAQTIKAACPADVAFTPAGRLAAMEQRVQGMVQAVALIRAPLDGFYTALSDEQKARFNALGRDEREPRNPSTPACGPNAVIPQWPQAQIERAVRPSEAQRAQLDKLKDATAKAANMLKAACPAETAATPPARLTAVAGRLDTLLQAVRLVRTALDDFYGSLSDEQKAQFNGIPPTVQNGQPRG
jgi:LTXXQ motif family protein